MGQGATLVARLTRQPARAKAASHARLLRRPSCHCASRPHIPLRLAYYLYYYYYYYDDDDDYYYYYYYYYYNNYYYYYC